MSLIDTRLLPERVYDAVRERIVSGDLAPGAPLRQDALAEELGVSKIPVREALTRLERDGLVRAHARRGFEVRPMTRADLEEIFDLRLQVEPAAAALGARRWIGPYGAVARKAMEALERAMKTGKGDTAELNRAFHLSLVRPALRPMTTDLVDRLHVMADRYVRAHLQPEGRTDRAVAEHRALLEAWCAHNADEVEVLLADHIIGTLNDLKRQIH